MKIGGGQALLRWKDGTTYRFTPFNGGRGSFIGAVLSAITDSNGNTITLNNNGAGRVSEAIDPVGRKLSFGYDSSNRINYISDPLGRFVQYTYNANGVLETFTNTEGGVTRYDYVTDDIKGYNLTKVTNPNGVVIAENIYDPYGRVIEQKRPDGTYLKFRYKLLGELVGIGCAPYFDPEFPFPIFPSIAKNKTNPSSTQYSNILLTVLVGKNTLAYNYLSGGAIDSYHNCDPTPDSPVIYAKSTDAKGKTTLYRFSPQGVLLNVTDPMGQTRTFEHDGNKQVTAIKGNGMCPSCGDPASGDQSFTYDGYGNRTSMTDALGHSSKVTYDHLGRVTATTDPQGGTTQFTYDANNNLTALTDAMGRVTSFSYDSMNRLIRRDTPLGKFDTRLYDANGNLSQFTDRRGQTASFSYDSVNMLTEEQYTDAKVKRTYDAAGRLVEVHDSTSGDYAFDYDKAGRLLRAVSPTGLVDYTHDDLGRTLTRQVAGQPAVNYAYDPLGNLSSATMLTHSLNFSYDPRNQPTTVQRSNGVQSNYSFDPAGRLLSLVHQNGTNVLNTQNYQYDEISNRTRFDNDIAQTLTTPPVKNSFNEANQLLTSGDKSYQYDDNGNLTAEISPAGRTDYHWDARNRLSTIKQPSGETLSFIYDYTGMMLTLFDTLGTTTTSRSYVLDDLTNVAYAFNQTGAGQSYLTGRGIDQHFASVSAGGHAQHALTDAINSTVATVDENGLMNGQFYYEPYGQTTAFGNDFMFQYTGRVPVTGNLYYYRARFYDAGMGRFFSEDKIGSKSYKYAKNNPIRFSDRLGLDASDNYDLSVSDNTAPGNPYPNNGSWGFFDGFLDSANNYFKPDPYLHSYLNRQPSFVDADQYNRNMKRWSQHICHLVGPTVLLQAAGSIAAALAGGGPGPGGGKTTQDYINLIEGQGEEQADGFN